MKPSTLVLLPSLMDGVMCVLQTKYTTGANVQIILSILFVIPTELAATFVKDYLTLMASTS